MYIYIYIYKQHTHKHIYIYIYIYIIHIFEITTQLPISITERHFKNTSNEDMFNA